eukprot:48024_1
MCSSDEDVVVSLRLIDKTDPFMIKPKQNDYITFCGNTPIKTQLISKKRKKWKSSAFDNCSIKIPWFYLWFLVIIWVPVIVLISFILIDPLLAFLSVGMYVLSMHIIVIILTLYYFRKYSFSVVAQTIWWQEFLVLFTFIMGFSVSYNGLVLKGSHFETQYDFWGNISIATNSLESSIIKFIKNAKNDKYELMKRILTLYYYLICVFHQSYNVTASINFIETMRWIKRIEPIINDLYKYGEYTFCIDNDGMGHKNKHVTINIHDLDVTSLDMIINEDILGLRKIFIRRDINFINNEQDHYHRYAIMPITYIKYIWPFILFMSMCGNIVFQFWFIYQLFEIYFCIAGVAIQFIFILIAIIYVLSKRSWIINNGWNFRILRNPTVFTAISCFSNDEIEEQINKLYNEFNQRKELLYTLNYICDNYKQYGLNNIIIDIIVNFIVDETKNIQQLTTKKRNRLIGRSSYVWKYMVQQNVSGNSLMESYQHIMKERDNSLLI